MIYFTPYEELAEAYDFYNKELFGDELPACIIVLSKSANNFGHFMPNSFVSNDGKEGKKHEIALNVQMFAIRKPELTLETLVHEMCHLKTFEDGDFGRGAYHNKIWAALMKSVGLIPSSTGEPGGKETGQKMSHYPEEGGLFERKTKVLLNKGFFISFVGRINKDVKSFTLPQIKKSAVDGKPGFYKDDKGGIFQGKTVKCGKDEEGKEIIKVIVKSNNRRMGYVCGCKKMVWVYGDLDATCNICGKKFVISERVK